MAQAKGYGSGWHKESLRHSNARRLGRAGGSYVGADINKLGISQFYKTNEQIMNDRRPALKFKGWVVGRKLYENNPDSKTASLRNFCYYPPKFHGKPPYLFKTKEEAEKQLAKMRKKGNTDAVVFKYTPETYLDRF